MLRKTLKFSLASAILMAGIVGTAQAETTLRAVMQSDLKIIDPIWTTAYITRNHGYMIYDTLFATDEKEDIKPQMLDHYTLSEDQLVYTMTLRDGLLWHDGKPVTAEDCVASIKRWAARDVLGQQMMSFVTDIASVDDKTIRITVNEPTGLVLLGLGRSTGPAFMMPKRIAQTNPQEQISEFIGSGPFIFKADEWTPGNKAVYVKFKEYKPRDEPPSGMAGGKVAKVDRVEWLALADQQTAVSALLNGEVDLIEQPSHDLLPMLTADPNIQTGDWSSLGNQYVFRFNSVQKPFDNVKVRQAMWYALNQKDFLKAVIGDPKYYKECKSIFICGTQLATEKGMDGLLGSNFKKARELLAEGGYDGTPIVLLHATDRQVYANLAPVAKSLLERAGMKVDMQSMDWQTNVMRRSKKNSLAEGGWSISLTSTNNAANPLESSYLNASCEKATFGWPCDKEIERLRSVYARESDPAKQKEIAEALQLRAIENPLYIPLGQWYQPMVARKSLTGLLSTPVPIFWNIAKTGS
ncbi:ABC transporter substrate-binding protein [Pollutimonas bauzanensis]|uniref:Peptide/nickel transport system substrate-binding protein n=1 Tax=Pollutimonas bauzanensis TaxID=658167 RepID=A0A1M5R1I7_9BURK|nr:ABC transporter substrate-binding protein [Pollutimonas bauzanensis]SHH19653.1 peptide/nickel transport system substrate-binding protein [Pollutimonas bauzanensis]